MHGVVYKRIEWMRPSNSTVIDSIGSNVHICVVEPSPRPKLFTSPSKWLTLILFVGFLGFLTSRDWSFLPIAVSLLLLLNPFRQDVTYVLLRNVFHKTHEETLSLMALSGIGYFFLIAFCVFAATLVLMLSRATSTSVVVGVAIGGTLIATILGLGVWSAFKAMRVEPVAPKTTPPR